MPVFSGGISAAFNSKITNGTESLEFIDYLADLTVFGSGVVPVPMLLPTCSLGKIAGINGKWTILSEDDDRNGFPFLHATNPGGVVDGAGILYCTTEKIFSYKSSCRAIIITVP